MINLLMGLEMMENLQNFVSWKMLFHGGVSLFYLSLVMTTYSSGANVMLVERMVTTWYLTVHIGFIFMALGLDFIRAFAGKSSQMAQYFASFNNIIFISVVFPFGLFVPLTYWSLFCYNCNLILPNIVEITVPYWISTSSHTVISLVVVMEMITTKYTYEGNYIVALTMMGVFSISYIMCLIRTYMQFGFWVYPVLHMIPEDELWMVFLALSVKLVALFFVGVGISFMIHGHESNNYSSSLLDYTAKSDSVNPAIESVSNETSDSSNDPVNPLPFTLKSESLPQNDTLPKQLRDFSIANGHKIDQSSINDAEVWHDAVYSPAVASFVENSSRKVPKPKKVYRKRIGNSQAEQAAKTYENLNRTANVLKLPLRDYRKVNSGPVIPSASVMPSAPVTPSAPITPSASVTPSAPVMSSASVISSAPVIPTPVTPSALGSCHSTSQSSFVLADGLNRKIDNMFKYSDCNLSMANIPAPVINDDIPMDSLESISVFPPPPSMVLENKRRKLKKPPPMRKEKSKSNVSLLNEDTGNESKSLTNVSSSGSFQKDVSKTKLDKEQETESSKFDTIILAKKDKKKKEDKGPKRMSKDILKKSSLVDASTDGWTYLECASRRGTGILDRECLDFETKSLPVNVDQGIVNVDQGVDGKKRDYQRDGICD